METNRRDDWKIAGERVGKLEMKKGELCGGESEKKGGGRVGRYGTSKGSANVGIVKGVFGGRETYGR